MVRKCCFTPSFMSAAQGTPARVIAMFCALMALSETLRSLIFRAVLLFCGAE
eukprot:CAMPEP_0198689772 /NCGR_PEP_ID=MMETSP1468-20131203/151315_1 /TAXON_ID=1461545 /ORGANISM="Mantoniella sp, Strain CCMP1436" /LENGTH=51 /DNA_ID=CAMNT_0044441205 /DNA_START=48 /DNA_END=203 /DNA_ORIENTATION=-